MLEWHVVFGSHFRRDASPFCNEVCVYDMKTRISAMHICHKGTGHKVQMMFVASYVITSHTQHAAMCEEIGFVFRCVCGCVCWEGQNKYHIDLNDHDCS